MAPVVEKAEQIERTEAREAEQAAKAVGRAVEVDRKVAGAPLSERRSTAAIEQKRALVWEAERKASNESKEAREATEAVRTIAVDPTKPVQPAETTPNDRVAEIRRKQAEMLEKLSKKRAQSRERSIGYEQGIESIGNLTAEEGPAQAPC